MQAEFWKVFMRLQRAVNAHYLHKNGAGAQRFAQFWRTVRTGLKRSFVGFWRRVTCGITETIFARAPNAARSPTTHLLLASVSYRGESRPYSICRFTLMTALPLFPEAEKDSTDVSLSFLRLAPPIDPERRFRSIVRERFIELSPHLRGPWRRGDFHRRHWKSARLGCATIC
jgi:hypothetical protein